MKVLFKKDFWEAFYEWQSRKFAFYGNPNYKFYWAWYRSRCRLIWKGEIK